MTNTAGTLARWEIQYRRRGIGPRPWAGERHGMGSDGVDDRSLAMAVLATHLMTVDHDVDLDDYRVVVRQGLRPAHVIVDEDSLMEYLEQQDYYRTRTRPPVRTVLDPRACQALPSDLQAELDRVGPPGPHKASV